MASVVREEGRSLRGLLPVIRTSQWYRRVRRGYMDLPVGRKLLVALGWIMAITAIGSSLVIHQALRLTTYEAINTRSDQAVSYLDRMHYDVDTANDAVGDYLVGRDAADVRKTTQFLAQFERDMQSARGILARDLPASLGAFDRYVAIARDFNRRVTKNHIDLARTGHLDQVTPLTVHLRGRELERRMDAHYQVLRRQVDTWADDCNGQTGSIVAVMLRIVLVASAGLIGGCFLIAWFVGMTVSAPLQKMTENLHQLAQGEPYQPLRAEEQRRDEIGEMARALTVFHSAALERLALEVDAADARVRADTARGQLDDAELIHQRHQEMVVGQLALGLQRLAEGNLRYRIGTEFPAAFENVRRDFNASMEQLGAAIGQVSTGAAEMHASARRVTQASGHMSAAIARQSTQIQSTASALREAADEIHLTSLNVAEAQATIERALDQASRADAVMGAAVDTIGDLADISSQIDACTSTIDTIAGHTNMLALNATIEAARAGEHGRGFAVVANEVRLLAQQAAGASQDIRKFNEVSGDRIGNGVRLLEESGRELTLIVSEIQTILAVSRNIAQSAEGQAQAVSLVRHALDEVELDGQGNATLADETTAIVRALGTEAHDLSASMQRFSVG